jgi:hypothetical protein
VKQIVAGTYDNQYSYNNVYGHAVALLRQHRAETIDQQLHLDIGCGYGRIAEPITADLGLAYVGADIDEGGLDSIKTRGFEAHSIALSDEVATHDALQRIVNGRRVRSITMLDTLEHLPDGDAVLRAISRLAFAHSAFVVISVPNVAHRDIGLKLAFGRWDYTEAGLLDHTHTRLFSSAVLDRVLRHAGLYTIASNDVCATQSDQCFPPTHPALAAGSQLHIYLAELRQHADPYGDVNQFVRICVPGAPAAELPYLRPGQTQKGPFLTVVVRTQGKRLHTLEGLLTALTGQSDTDFEVLVIGHKLSLERQIAVERTIEDCPEWLRAQSRLLLVDGGNRTRPLNEGFAAATGDYIVILDDDDTPFGHWVEVFHNLAEKMPGRMLRAVSIRQRVANVTIDGRMGLRTIGPPEKIFPPEFDYISHLRMNHTPGLSVAFPRGVFHDLGLRFDETLTTTEDWDFIMRAAPIVGTACSPEITSIYHWWEQDESSRTIHGQEEWDRNHARILQKMDGSLVLFPVGTVSRIRHLLDQDDGANGGHSLLPVAHSDRIHKLQEVFSILNSTSWRISGPLRFVSRLFGKPRIDYSHIWDFDADRLAVMAVMLRRSRSWRITAPLRRIRSGQAF